MRGRRPLNVSAMGRLSSLMPVVSLSMSFLRSKISSYESNAMVPLLIWFRMWWVSLLSISWTTESVQVIGRLSSLRLPAKKEALKRIPFYKLGLGEEAVARVDSLFQKHSYVCPGKWGGADGKVCTFFSATFQSLIYYPDLGAWCEAGVFASSCRGHTQSRLFCQTIIPQLWISGQVQCREARAWASFPTDSSERNQGL